MVFLVFDFPIVFVSIVFYLLRVLVQGLPQLFAVLLLGFIQLPIQSLSNRVNLLSVLFRLAAELSGMLFS